MEELFLWLLRAVGYFLVEILFYNVLYYIGWAACKVVTLGKEPASYKREDKSRDIVCSLLGLFIVIFVVLYFAGFFET